MSSLMCVPVHYVLCPSLTQKAWAKFKADIQHIGSCPGDAPKQRLVMMQIMLCKLIDAVDPDEDDGAPPLVKRDFRLAPYLAWP